MGLRQDKQQRQRIEIIENAIALFRERGFGGVKVREIAARSLVSEATFFNYFGSKEAVLCEWARAAVDHALDGAAKGTGPLRREVRKLARQIASAVMADEALMREAWQRQRISPGPAQERGRPTRSNGALRLVEAARRNGEVRGDVAPELLADLLRSTLEATLAHWLDRPLAGHSPGAASASHRASHQARAAPQAASQAASQAQAQPPAQSLAASLSGAADLLLDAYRKRNERVRAGASAARASQPTAAR
jgi:AcrR family transcriptional regulator